MIEGTPLLVTLDGIGTIRTMELNSSGVFQQIASQGGFTTTTYGPEYAFVDWAVDEVIVCRGVPASSNRVITLHTILMDQLTVVNQNVNGSTQQWHVGYNKVTSDAITRIIVEQGIEFRYVVLHHDGAPILRHDYQKTVQVARDDKLVIEVPSFGILSYVA